MLKKFKNSVYEFEQISEDYGSDDYTLLKFKGKVLDDYDATLILESTILFRDHNPATYLDFDAAEFPDGWDFAFSMGERASFEGLFRMEIGDSSDLVTIPSGQLMFSYHFGYGKESIIAQKYNVREFLSRLRKKVTEADGGYMYEGGKGLTEGGYMFQIHYESFYWCVERTGNLSAAYLKYLRMIESFVAEIISEMDAMPEDQKYLTRLKAETVYLKNNFHRAVIRSVAGSRYFVRLPGKKELETTHSDPIVEHALLSQNEITKVDYEEFG